MTEYQINAGRGRTKLQLSAHYMGDDIIVRVFNKNAHIGAVAIAEYAAKEKRVSTSVITRLGHKDDIIAQRVAYAVTKSTKRTCCVIAGIHLDEITGTEIEEIEKNSEILVSKLKECSQ
jgi:hypothetical protein